MLEWIVRWGVPLALVATYVVMTDSHGRDPSAVAEQALTSFRDALQGMVPRLF